MKKALIVYGGWEGHYPTELSELFGSWLTEAGFSVTKSDTLDVFADESYLSGFDLLVPIWTMGELPDEYAKNVSKVVAAGCGMAGCHGGMCDSFRNNCEWQFITGAQWVAHPGNSDYEYEVNIKKSADSPLVAGISDFRVKSEQYYIHVDPAVHVLATTSFPVADGPHAANGKVDVPVVFTKKWGKGKIYYNSLGHSPETFDIPEAKELMLRGLIWAAR